jgi:hypothetical protein
MTTRKNNKDKEKQMPFLTIEKLKELDGLLCVFESQEDFGCAEHEADLINWCPPCLAHAVLLMIQESPETLGLPRPIP